MPSCDKKTEHHTPVTNRLPRCRRKRLFQSDFGVTVLRYAKRRKGAGWRRKQNSGRNDDDSLKTVAHNTDRRGFLRGMDAVGGSQRNGVPRRFWTGRKSLLVRKDRPLSRHAATEGERELRRVERLCGAYGTAHGRRAHIFAVPHGKDRFGCAVLDQWRRDRAAGRVRAGCDGPPARRPPSVRSASGGRALSEFRHGGVPACRRMEGTALRHPDTGAQRITCGDLFLLGRRHYGHCLGGTGASQQRGACCHGAASGRLGEELLPQQPLPVGAALWLEHRPRQPYRHLRSRHRASR